MQNYCDTFHKFRSTEFSFHLGVDRILNISKWDLKCLNRINVKNVVVKLRSKRFLRTCGDFYSRLFTGFDNESIGAFARNVASWFFSRKKVFRLITLYISVIYIDWLVFLKQTDVDIYPKRYLVDSKQEDAANNWKSCCHLKKSATVPIDEEQNRKKIPLVWFCPPI